MEPTLKIMVIATGSRGDVQPYLALAKGLQGAGYQVRLVTHENFEALVMAQGVEFWPIAGDVQQVAQSQEMRDLLEKGNFIRIMALMGREARRGARLFAQAALEASQGIDLIIAGFGGIFTGMALAKKLNLPLLPAYYIPFTPTRAYPSFIAPKLPQWLNGVLNPISYAIARQVMWQGLRSADRLARREILDLPAAPFWGAWPEQHFPDMPVLYGYSPAVLPKPDDWDARFHVTGYWFLETDADWQPSEAFVSFLQAGPAPVYIGFGSMSSRDPQGMSALISEAVQLSGQRAILLSGWAGLQQQDLPDQILVIDSAPFDWLFPQMAAVVHHGGAGTTAAGLRAGVPNIIVPFMGDQPFWGQRVHELGVGPAPIPRKQLTPANLAQAIRSAVHDTDMRSRAAALGQQIQAEDGVAKAAAVIRAYEKRWFNQPAGENEHP